MRKYVIFCLAVVLALCGCAGEPAVPAETTAPAPTQTTAPTIVPETIDVQAEAEALAPAPEPAAPVVLEAEASGEAEQRCDDAVIDYSHTSDGYVMVQYMSQTENRLKVLVKGPATTYSYNLTPGQWTVFPLSDGNGSYQVGVYENVVDSKYATVLAGDMEVTLSDEFAPFLRPNQYVNYADAPAVVALGAELTAELEAPLEKVAAVYDYVVLHFSYDYEKAETVKSGYIPELDQVLAEQKGICLDYAAVMTAMLRSQQIPCKMVVGYAGEVYHSWISVWTEENGWVDGIIFFDGHVWKRMDPTFASSGGGSEEIMDFIENGSYTVKYLY